MKTKQLLLTCLLAVAGSMTANAYDFEVDGIYYNKTSENTVEVTYAEMGEGNADFYNGYIHIPSSISTVSNYNVTRIYDVTRIGENAFEYCTGLTYVWIPSSVSSIGSGAFCYCHSLTEVDIPCIYNTSDVPYIEIESGAFQHCNSLSSFWLASTVKSIGTNFYDCKSLTELVVDPNNPIYDSRNNCNAIIETASNTLIVGCQKTIIPNSVTGIGMGAFYRCTGLTSISIPNGVTTIGERAFERSQNLTTVTIPSSVTNIGKRSFGVCSSLTSVISYIEEPFAFGSNAFSSINSDAVLYVPIGTRDKYIAAGWTEEVFGGGIVETGPAIEFADANVKAVCVANWDTNGDGELSETEAEAVTSLGTVFMNNTKIKKFTELQYFTGLTALDDNSFYKCENLTSVTLPANITSIGARAFSECTYLASVTIPNSVTSIGTSAFSQCINLTSVTIPGNVTCIGDYAFSWCHALKSVTLGNGVRNIGRYAFQRCYALTSITIPNSVTSFDDGAFYACTGLKSVTIPSSVTSIGNSAFAECGGLTSITIPGSVTSIGFGAFMDCTGLKSINIGDGVTSIDDCAFQGCSSLTSVTIPNSMTSIGVQAFCECSSLTSITIPNSVTSIGELAFYGTPWYNNMPNGMVYAGKVAYNYKGEMPAGTKIVIQDGTLGIASSAFVRCSGLTSITIPNSVTNIGHTAFQSCSGLTDVYCYAVSVPTTGSNIFYNTPIASATLHVPAASLNAYSTTEPWSSFGTIVAVDNTPIINFADAGVKALCVANWDTNGDGELSEEEAAAVTSLGKVFKEKTNITSFNELQYFTGLTSIGYEAFYNCWRLTSITIPNSVTSIDSYAFYKCSGLTSITIPNSVTSIDSYAFSNCSGLTSITIPNSVTYISLGAFSNCSGLTSITIPNSVTSIGIDAFCQCTNLISVTIPNSVTSIGNCAFYECGLTSITIPNSVTSIGHQAFYHCSGLTSVTIPNSVTSIGIAVFGWCDGLTSIKVETGNTKYDSRNNCNAIIEIASNTLIAGCKNTTIPNSVTSIGEEAFYSLASLTSITIPNSVTSIDEWAFRACISLTSVTIGNGVTSIGDDAFNGCRSLTDVYCYAENIPNTGDNVFDYSNIASATLHVPRASLNAYRTTEPWSGFGTIIAIDDTPIIDFADANVKALCVANWDTNGDGELSEEEAAAVTNLGDVFKGNTTITSFDELQYFTGLDSIGYYAFGGCSSLASVKIPNSVTNIGEYAFENCSSLTSITIPKSVTSIGDFAFSYCSGLASMVVESGNPKYDSRDNCNAIIETEKNDIRVGCKNTIIPNGIARIRKGAFCGCSGLTSIALPDGVTSIGYRTFADCSSLTAINIPEGVTSIGDWSFENCHSLKTVTIPSIPSIGKGAFSGCGSLSSITCYAEDVPVAGDHIFYNVMISAATLHVPAGSVEAYRTTAPWSDFGTIVAIDETSPVIAFADANVKAICVANWDTDGDGELSKAEAAAVTDLGEVFIGNTEITSFNELQFFTGLTSIGESAFYECSGLTSITIPNSVTSIGDCAFQECTSLTSITIPNSVTSIGGNAFYECTSLTSITIPKGVTSIGYEAFYGAKLRNILIKCVTPPDALEDQDPAGRVDGTFSRQSIRHATLYVPFGCWETYAFDENWYVFHNIRETATEEAQISMQQAYTLMDAGTFTYSVYDPVNDRISSVNVINEDNPNHCWQVIDVDGERYLYNIGAKKFVTTAGDYMRLSGNATSIEMQNGNDGIVLGEQKGRQWAFVNNDNMNVEDAIADMIKGITPTFTEDDDAAVYNLAGQRLSKPQKGINIKNGKKYLVK